jgi:hypothetical protein
MASACKGVAIVLPDFLGNVFSYTRVESAVGLAECRADRVRASAAMHSERAYCYVSMMYVERYSEN